MDNFTCVTGNITREPELKFLANGSAVANFGLAVNRRWENKTTHEWQEQTSFLDITAWAELAENVAESLTKGARVTVSGRLEQQSWEQDGAKRSKVVIIADDVAPSLKYATAHVTKVDRRGPGAAPTAAQEDMIRGAFGTAEEEPF